MVSYYDKNKELVKQRTKDWQRDNPDKVKEYNSDPINIEKKKEYVKNNPNKRKQTLDNYYAKNKELCNERNRLNYQKNRESYLLKAKLKLENQRNRLYDILGGKKCVKCGYVGLALNFEHINNDGAQDRKIIGNSKKQLYYYLNHPEEAKQKLQVYCANCNWEKELTLRSSQS